MTPEEIAKKHGATLEEDFLTEPLVGLCPQPMHLMTDEELREYVIQLRQYRQGFQTYKAEVEKSEAVKVKRPKAEKVKKDEFKDFDF